MRKVCLIAVAMAVYGWAGVRAVAQEAPKPAQGPVSRTPTIDQSLEMKSAFNPKISPDGRRVVYELQSANWEDNSFDRNLWIADIASGEVRQLTSAKKSSTGADWSPDGKWIAFVSDRPAQISGSTADKKQLYVISADGGEAQQLSKSETDVGGFEWAPDSRRIAFAAADPEPKTLKDRKEKYGEYSVVHADYQMAHLWMIDLPDGTTNAAPEAKRLTEGDAFSVGSFAWSPDGTRIAFSAQKDSDIISAYSNDIYVVQLADKVVKKIVDTPGPDTNPKWSPDGKRIAFQTGAGSKYFYYTNGRIAVVPAEGGTPEVVTAAFDEDPSLIDWGPDGIYFEAAQKTYAHIFRVNPETRVVQRLDTPDHAVAVGFSFTRDFKHAAFRAALENEYGEIYIASVAPWEGKKLTTMGDQLKGFTLARREVISWKSADGTTIEGVLYTPSDFSLTKKYPLQVVIHGGPTGVDQPIVNADRYYPIERF